MKKYVIAAALFLAGLTVDTNTAEAQTMVNCKVKTVVATWASQAYVQCEHDFPKSYTIKAATPDNTTPIAPSDAAIARFLSIMLAAKLSGREVTVAYPAGPGWACTPDNCNITGFILK